MNKLPTSPSEIPFDISLADLESIRLHWIETAREAHIPEKLFDIAYRLGSQGHDSRGIFRLLTIGDIRVWASTKGGTRNAQANAWNMTRRLTVYLDPGQSIQVVDWQWHYVAQDVSEEPLNPDEGNPADLLYLPGAWAERVLAMGDQADQARIDTEKELEEQKRDALARRLLCGNYYFGNG